MNFRILVFAIENKSQKTISNIEIDLKILRFPVGSTIEHADPTYGSRLAFEDGATALNADSSKSVILAHQSSSDKRMFWGAPDDPQGEIFAGLFYKGIIVISGDGSKTKRNPFLIEAMQYSEPVFTLREMVYDD